jgi:hypothetical protein
VTYALAVATSAGCTVRCAGSVAASVSASAVLLIKDGTIKLASSSSLCYVYL